MARVNKTENNLQAVWHDLDTAYEYMERAIEKMSDMVDLPDELVSEYERFDMSAISGMKEFIEILIEERKKTE